MSLALSLGICSPVNAISMQDEILTDNLESMMQVLEKETTNEYDYIVEIRDAKKNAKAIANVSEEEVEYITSDAIESELLYRSTLPTEVLKDQYCYSDEAIDVLRDYNGEKLEENPELRAVTATLSAALGELVKSDTRMGVIYTWSWDSKPLVLFTDYTVEEIAKILGIGRTAAYSLVHSGVFKAVRIGSSIRVSKVSFDDWLDKQNM